MFITVVACIKLGRSEARVKNLYLINEKGISMIKLLHKGHYKVIGTPARHLMLYLGTQPYHWAYAAGIGDILTYSKTKHRQKYLLVEGEYRLYGVKDEPKLIDLKHLELSVGPKKWQGYLLLTGLPNYQKIRSRIEPTNELISKERG